jgi:cysteine desulfurase
MYVNNEIGSVMPIKEIGRLVREVRKERTKNGLAPLYFHCDAVQAVQYFDCSVDSLNVDLLSLTAHKVYGPKGVGALYVRDGIEIVRQLDGGGQEYYKRAGTENVAGIVGAGEAFAEIEEKREYEFQRLHGLQDLLIEGVLARVEGVRLTGPRENRAPHITSFFFENKLL